MNMRQRFGLGLLLDAVLVYALTASLHWPLVWALLFVLGLSVVALMLGTVLALHQISQRRRRLADRILSGYSDYQSEFTRY